MQYPLRSVPANVPVCLHQPPPNTADSRHLRPTKCVVAALRLPMPAPRRLSPPRHPHARLARAAPAAHISVVKVPVPAPNPALASRSVQRRFIQAARKDISTSPQPCQVPIAPLTPSGYPRLPHPSLPPALACGAEDIPRECIRRQRKSPARITRMSRVLRVSIRLCRARDASEDEASLRQACAAQSARAT